MVYSFWIDLEPYYVLTKEIHEVNTAYRSYAVVTLWNLASMVLYLYFVYCGVHDHHYFNVLEIFDHRAIAETINYHWNLTRDNHDNEYIYHFSNNGNQ